MISLEAIERHADHVRRETDRLVEEAALEVARATAAEQSGEDRDLLPTRQRLLEGKLAAIARQLTRGQAALILPTDERHAAAQQVIRYCDEADRRPWNPLPPVELGEVAA